MQDHENSAPNVPPHKPWNKGKLIGAKPLLRPKHVWSIRTKLQVEGRVISGKIKPLKGAGSGNS